MRLITIENVNRLTALIPFNVFGIVRRQNYPFKRAGFHNEQASRQAAGISCFSTGVQNLIVVAICFLFVLD